MSWNSNKKLNKGSSDGNYIHTNLRLSSRAPVKKPEDAIQIPREPTIFSLVLAV